MRVLEKCFSHYKSLLGIRYTDSRGLHVIANKELRNEDIQFFVKEHVTHIKQKVSDNLYSLNYFEYKKQSKSNAKCQTQPVWDGPISFLRFACKNHCTFRIMLHQNTEDSNRFDSNLEIRKDTVQPQEELTMYHKLVDSDDHPQYWCASCNNKKTSKK